MALIQGTPQCICDVGISGKFPGSYRVMSDNFKCECFQEEGFFADVNEYCVCGKETISTLPDSSRSALHTATIPLRVQGAARCLFS
jgi:hypothetical protein